MVTDPIVPYFGKKEAKMLCENHEKSVTVEVKIRELTQNVDRVNSNDKSS